MSKIELAEQAFERFRLELLTENKFQDPTVDWDSLRRAFLRSIFHILETQTTGKNIILE